MVSKSLEKYESRLSDLPDCIIHHILSLLGKERDYNIPSLRATSKRFRKICSSYLSFNITKGGEKLERFKNYVDDFLSKKDAAIDNIISFNIEMTSYQCLCYSHISSVLDWVHELIKFNVEEISLKELSSFLLPSFIFNIKTLKVLKIEADHIELPRLVFLCLQELLIDEASACKSSPDKKRYDKYMSIGEWISSFCPSMKRLSVCISCDERNGHDFVVTSSSLEDLVVSIRTIHNWNYDINICTLNLKTLSLNLKSYNGEYDITKGSNIVRINAPGLHDFTFEVDRLKECEFSGEFFCLRKAYCIGVPHDCNYLSALHRRIIGVTSLQIDFFTFQALSKSDESMTANLRYLIMSVKTNLNYDEYIPSLISFVKRLINLKSLTIGHLIEPRGVTRTHFIEDMKILEEESNEAHFESLKELVIVLNDGTEREIWLVKYFLNNAENLEKATVHYPNGLLLDIQNFEMASTSLKLYFLEF